MQQFVEGAWLPMSGDSIASISKKPPPGAFV